MTIRGKGFAIGKGDSPSFLLSRMKYGVSRSPLPSQLFLTANEKDFSLSLEMTMRGKGFAIGKAAFSLLPLEGGAP